MPDPPRRWYRVSVRSPIRSSKADEGQASAYTEDPFAGRARGPSYAPDALARGTSQSRQFDRLQASNSARARSDGPSRRVRSITPVAKTRLDGSACPDKPHDCASRVANARICSSDRGDSCGGSRAMRLIRRTAIHPVAGKILTGTNGRSIGQGVANALDPVAPHRRVIVGASAP